MTPHHLDGGIRRQIHVSRSRIKDGLGRCVIIEQPSGRLFAHTIKIEGPSEVLYSRQKIEGGANVWIETEAPLIAYDVREAK